MVTKQNMQDNFAEAVDDIQRFIDSANYNGGMGIDARLKLVENRLDDVYWFIKHLIDALPGDPKPDSD